MKTNGGGAALPLWVAADLGSNTFRMIVAEETGHGTLTEKTMLQSVVRLGEGLGSGGKITSAALDRAEKCLLEFKKALPSGETASITAATTAAGRDLTGSSLITEMAETILGTRIFVPTGPQEAALSYLGAANLLPGETIRTILLDIGGGSTEIASGHGLRAEFTESLKLGVVRLTEETKPADPAGSKGYSLLKKRAMELLSATTLLKTITPAGRPRSRLLLNAGTPLTLAAMKTGLDPAHTRKLTGTPITFQDVKKAANLFKLTKRDDILKIHGVVSGREDVITAGTAILEAFMELSGIKLATVTDGGLCEGLLINAYEKQRRVPGPRIEYHTQPATC